MSKKVKDTKLLILGSGPAGCSAAIYGARAYLTPLLITGPTRGGQLTTTTLIENWPSIASIEGVKLMENMIKHSKIYGALVAEDIIERCNLNLYPFELESSNHLYRTEALIIATGANPKYLGLTSEKKYRGSGVSFCATCDGFFYRNKKVLVVGGGNTALEEANYLAKIAKSVILIHRRDQFRAEKLLRNRFLSNVHREGSNIEVLLNYELIEILGDGEEVKGAIIKNNHTEIAKQIELDGIFIAIGRDPDTSLFKDQLEMINGGYIKIKRAEDNMTQTSIPGVFACGDVADPVYKQAITSAGSGCMALIDASRYLEEKV